MTKTLETLKSLKDKLIAQKKVLSTLNLERKKQLTEFQDTKAALLLTMQHCGMTEYADEENKLTFEIKKKPKKSGHSTIAKLLEYLKETKKEPLDNAAIELIQKWSKIIHTRDDKDVKLYIKSISEKAKKKKLLQLKTPETPDV